MLAEEEFIDFDLVSWLTGAAAHTVHLAVQLRWLNFFYVLAQLIGYSADTPVLSKLEFSKSADMSQALVEARGLPVSSAVIKHSAAAVLQYATLHAWRLVPLCAHQQAV